MRDKKGTYNSYKGKKFTLPSGKKKEIDHQLPHSITSGSAGPKTAVPLHKHQHRRKNTTGSSKWAKHHRNYLNHAQQGNVPFTGKMQDKKDYRAAATSIDIRGTYTKRTLLAQHGNEPLEPRIPPKSHEVTEHQDAMSSLDETLHMVNKMKERQQIDQDGVQLLNDTVSDVRGRVNTLYGHTSSRSPPVPTHTVFSSSTSSTTPTPSAPSVFSSTSTPPPTKKRKRPPDDPDINPRPKKQPKHRPISFSQSARRSSHGTMASQGIFPTTPTGPGPQRGTKARHYGDHKPRPKWR